MSPPRSPFAALSKRSPDLEDTPDNPLGEAFCTTREAAQLLGVSLRTAQLWVDSGILRAWKTAGGHRRVARDSIDALLRGKAPDRVRAPGETEAEMPLARRPVLDSLRRVVAYELYRLGGYPQDADQAVAAGERLIAYVYSDLGLGVALGQHLCHLALPSPLPADEVLQMLPREQTVLELDARRVLDEAELARCRELKQQGYRLALAHYPPAGVPPALLALADVVKLSLEDYPGAGLAAMFQRLRSVCRAQLQASDVATPDAYQACRELGFDLYEGYHFAHPGLVLGKRLQPNHLALLELLNLIMGEAGNREIENAMKVHPDLCYGLLRLANSAAMGLNRRVGGIGEVIALLGRRQLQRWAHLLLFARQEEQPYPSPLLALAALRGRLMEQLAAGIRPCETEFQDRAFMVGILSLVDVLTRVPMTTLLTQLRLPDDVREALSSQAGDLGRLLAIAEALEGRGEALSEAPLPSPLNVHGVMRAQVAALHWVSGLGETAFH